MATYQTLGIMIGFLEYRETRLALRRLGALRRKLIRDLRDSSQLLRRGLLDQRLRQ